jgi:chorismate mutase/prephenate dehydrogenase
MQAELKALRDQIDAVDRRLLKLLTERLKLVLQVGELKRQHGMVVRDDKRERDMLEALPKLAEAPLTPESVYRTYVLLIDEARTIEEAYVYGNKQG